MCNIFRSKNGGHQQWGFTLIEVLIAMAVAAIGLLSLFYMQGNAVKGNIAGNKFTQATYLAQDKLECIKDGNIVEAGTFGFIDMSGNDQGIVKEAGVIGGIDEKGDLGGPFNLQWEIATHTEWSRKVTVNVSWKSIFGSMRKVSLTSISRGNGN